jgi:hypothetical protein
MEENYDYQTKKLNRLAQISLILILVEMREVLRTTSLPRGRYMRSEGDSSLLRTFGQISPDRCCSV